MILQDNERLDDLQLNGLRLIQKKDGFCFGIDAVLLANFVDVRKNNSVVDLGTGTGIIPVLLAGKTQARSIIGLEIQADMAEMASRSIRLNNLQDRIGILCMDLRKSVEHLGSSRFNVVVSNPPYINQGSGLLNPCDTKAISRHEIMCNLEDIISVANRLLISGGQFAMVHRPHRLVDIMYYMRKYSIEPKYLRFVHPSSGKRPNLLLVKGIKGAKPELRMMDPLYVYDENGNYSREIDKIYGRINEEV